VGRGLAAPALLILIAGALGAQVEDRAHQRQRLDRLRGQIEDQRRQEAQLEDQAKGLEQEIAELERRLRGQQIRLQQLRRQLTEVDRQVAATERSVEHRTHAVEQKRLALEQTLATLYRLGRLSYIKVLLSARSVGGVLRNNRALAFLARRDAGAIEGYRVELSRLAQDRVRLAAQRRQLEALHDQALAVQVEIAAAQERQSELLADVRSRLRASQKVRAGLESQARGLRELLARITPSAPRSRPALPRPAAERLPWPVERGVIVFPFGELREGQTVISWPGIDMWVPAETPVVAVQRGRVLYSDAVKGLGHVVVIDHGDDLRSIYAKLGDPQVAAGDQVEQGRRIGTVVSVGPEEDTNFLFSLNAAGRPVDPSSWLQRR
jgi:septal ring factor EnvC (AmiA/AmiB activator)